jgi:hypothetical protein
VPKIIEMLNHRFGRLTVVAEVERTANGNRSYQCRCDCGHIVPSIAGYSLRSGSTMSCGCHRTQLLVSRNTKHGKSNTRVYKIWLDMIHRCTTVKHAMSHRYAVRGITVVERWKIFENFYADMGDPPDDTYTLESKDNDKGYEPLNCTWATRMEQANNRSTNRFLTHDGRTQTLAQWAREIGCAPEVISRRIQRGWTIARALSYSTR